MTTDPPQQSQEITPSGDKAMIGMSLFMIIPTSRIFTSTCPLPLRCASRSRFTKCSLLFAHLICFGRCETFNADWLVIFSHNASALIFEVSNITRNTLSIKWTLPCRKDICANWDISLILKLNLQCQQFLNLLESNFEGPWHIQKVHLIFRWVSNLHFPLLYT